MKMRNLKSVVTCIAAAAAICLTGCGGAKVLKEPQPLVLQQSLATASDQYVAVNFDWVIVRGGPGTWAKNADWDEYLVRVQNLGGDTIRVTEISLVDSLGTRIEPRYDRKQLVNGAKEAKRRYKGEKLQVKAGASAAVLLAGAPAAYATAGFAVISGGLYSSTAAAAATGGLILVPVFAVGSVFRGVNNSKVNSEIESRQTLLPIEFADREEKGLDVFFPLTPSPRQIEIGYIASGETRTLIIDTHSALEGLHLVQAKK